MMLINYTLNLNHFPNIIKIDKFLFVQVGYQYLKVSVIYEVGRLIYEATV